MSAENPCLQCTSPETASAGAPIIPIGKKAVGLRLGEIHTHGLSQPPAGCQHFSRIRPIKFFKIHYFLFLQSVTGVNAICMVYILHFWHFISTKPDMIVIIFTFLDDKDRVLLNF
ncbi:hypothetical protein, partial [Desulfovibrio sp.]